MTGLSGDFHKIVSANIRSNADTVSLERKALSILQNLARIPDRLHRYASSFMPIGSIDPQKILLAMLEHAPNEGGTRYAASAIVTCGEETSALVELANYWLRYLLLVFQGNSGTRGGFEASDYATPTLEDTQISLDPITTSRGGNFRKSLLQRDGYRCVLTQHYDISSMVRDFPVPSPYDLLDLKASHIMKRAVATFDQREDSSAYATWDIIRNYAHWPDQTLEHMMACIDSPENGFMLEHNLHRSFDSFVWTLVPEISGGQMLPHTYRVKVIRNNRMPKQIRRHDIITFQNCDAPEGLREPVEACAHPLPDPRFLALHAALAQVLQASGAGDAIDLYMDRAFREGPAVPSDKIRHGDELAVLLSQMQV